MSGPSPAIEEGLESLARKVAENWNGRELDTAWAAAEAALPDGWVIWGFQRATKNDMPENDEVMAWAGPWMPGLPSVKGVGRTLIDALRALTTRLASEDQS